MSGTQTHLAQVWSSANSDLTLQRVPTHQMKPGHVLIRTTAVALNPGDYKLRYYASKIDVAALGITFPMVLGTDGVGVIEAMADDVERLSVGDKVVYNGLPAFETGAYQQYSLQPAFAVGKVPPEMTDTQASSLPCGVFTGIALFHFLGIPLPWENPFFGAHKVIFITGGASSVGQYTIQLARLSGFDKIITTGSLHSEALLQNLGATHFLDRSLDADAQFKAIAAVLVNEDRDASSGIFVADAIASPETLEVCFRVAKGLGSRSGGPKVAAVHLVPEDIQARFPEVLWKYVYGNVRNDPVGASKFFLHLGEYVRSGQLKANRIRMVGESIEAIPAGIELLKSGVSGEKLVVVF